MGQRQHSLREGLCMCIDPIKSQAVIQWLMRCFLAILPTSFTSYISINNQHRDVGNQSKWDKIRSKAGGMLHN